MQFKVDLKRTILLKFVRSCEQHLIVIKDGMMMRRVKQSHLQNEFVYIFYMLENGWDRL